jgi:hypothetical protein
MLASDFNESLNVVDVTFKKNSDSIKAWSKNLTSTFGIGQFQAVRFAGTMGSILKTVGFGENAVLGMSKKIVELSGDLASFKNLQVDEAFNKIRAGLLGEVEPLREVGILMDENTTKAYAMANGLDKKWEKLSQVEKMLWRYRSLLAQTADAEGDFSRTGDSFANQLKTLQVELENIGLMIGNVLLPYANQLVRFLKELAAAFQNLNPEQQKMVTITVAIAAALPPLLLLLGALANIASFVVGGLAMIAGAMTTVVTPTMVVITLIASLIAIIIGFNVKNQELNSNLTNTQKKFVIIAKIIMTIINIFKAVIAVINFFGKLAINVISIVGEGFFGLVHIIVSALNLGGQFVEDSFKWMGDTIYNIFEGVKYTVLNAIDDMIYGVVEKINGLIIGLNSLPFIENIDAVSYTRMAGEEPKYRNTDILFTQTKWRVAELKSMVDNTFDILGDRVQKTMDDSMNAVHDFTEAIVELDKISKDPNYGMNVWNTVTGFIGGAADKAGKYQKPTDFIPTTDDIIKDLGDIADAGNKAGKSLGDTGNGLKDTFDDIGQSIDDAVKKLFDLDKAFYKITFERFSPGKILRRTTQALKYTTETITGINRLQEMGVNQNIIQYLQGKGVEGLGIVRGLLGADTKTRNQILGNIGLTQGIATAGVAGWNKREIHVSGGLEVKMGNETIKLSKEAVEKIVAGVIADNATRYF